MKADALSYNLKQDVVIATGPCQLHASITGDHHLRRLYLEVTGDMKRGDRRAASAR